MAGNHDSALKQLELDFFKKLNRLCFSGLTLTLTVTESALLHTCNGNDLEQCALSADSLLKDPNLVFPDSPASLDRVCR